MKDYYTYHFVFRFVTLIPEESEDMWHAYNLVCVDDTLRSTTIRYGQYCLPVL